MDPKLTALKDIILAATDVEKIYVTGCREVTNKVRSIFTDDASVWDEVGSYDFLIVANIKMDKFAEVQDMIENRCHHVMAVTCMVMAIDYYDNLIKTGNPFALFINDCNCVLHDARRHEWSKPDPKKDWKELNKRECQAWNRNASSYLTTAEMHLLRKEYNPSVLMLHQATEQYFMCLYQSVTGYRVNTHNIDKMHRYCRHLSAEIYDLFPRRRQVEVDLFNVFNRSYRSARYDADFAAKEADIKSLMVQVNKLREITERYVQVM